MGGVLIKCFGLTSPVTSPGVQTSDEREKSNAELSCDKRVIGLDDTIIETLKEMAEAREMISNLQTMLQGDCVPDEGQDAPMEQTDKEQELVNIRSSLEQNVNAVRELKNELVLCKEDIKKLEELKDTQLLKLHSQETLILQMKRELNTANINAKEIRRMNAELRVKLERRKILLEDFQKDIEEKTLQIGFFKYKLEESQKLKADLEVKLEKKTRMLEDLISDIKYKNSGKAESNGHAFSGSSATSGQEEEVQLLRDSLKGLRSNFRENDPQQHTLDTLEQGIVSLFDRLRDLQLTSARMEVPKLSCLQFDPFYWPKSENPFAPPPITQVLCFTGKSQTPSEVTIQKRLNVVTLRDVKEVTGQEGATGQEGKYTYRFKTLDPEFGTVKREVFLDDAVVPGCDGKIVVWVEEKHGQPRPM